MLIFQPMNLVPRLSVLCSVLATVCPAKAADFEKEVLPLMARYCHDCHGDGEGFIESYPFRHIRTQ